LRPPAPLSLPLSFSTGPREWPVPSAICRCILAVPFHPRQHRRPLLAPAVLLPALLISLPLPPSGHNSSPYACWRSPASWFHPTRHVPFSLGPPPDTAPALAETTPPA